MLAYDEILKNSPGLREVIEGKIADEVGKKQTEIDALKAENQELQTRIVLAEQAIDFLVMGGM